MLLKLSVSGNSISVSNFLFQLNVDPAGPAFDLKVPVEIMIGSVPLRQAGDRATVVGPEAVTPADFTQWATSSFPSSAGGATGVCLVYFAKRIFLGLLF